jgi:hypothetical protein
MRWEDESYVKLYTRDTLTWRSWGWQARTVFLHLLRKVDGAGMLVCEGFDPTDAVALMVDLPVEVVTPGLSQLAKSGTISIGPGVIIVANFVEAQEARKTDKLRKKDQRQRDRDQARSQGAAIAEVSHGVTRGHAASKKAGDGHAESHAVTRGHAESHAVTLQNASTSSPASSSSSTPEAPAVPPRVAEASGPPLADLLSEAHREARGASYEWQRRDDDALRSLLAKAPEEEILRRWRIALGTKFPRCIGVASLLQNWNAYAADEATGPPQQQARPAGTLRTGAVACAVSGCQEPPVYVACQEHLDAFRATPDAQTHRDEPQPERVARLMRWVGEQNAGRAA